MTFFDGRGEVFCDLSYRTLRDRAQDAAKRLLALPCVSRGDRVAIVAETKPDFAVLFFACQYAGLVPVPVPATVSLGGREQYLKQLQFLVANSGARAAFATEEFAPFLDEACRDLDIAPVRTLSQLTALPAVSRLPEPPGPHEVAYVQYTSGSTRMARGAVITQRAVMCNLGAIIKDGLDLRPDDRFFSWLPFYHDMGLVGKLLVPVAGQVPVGYIGTREFAMRPRLWLGLIEQTRATISFGPPFGYELCARRFRHGEGAQFDLGCWRVAGVGAEMIRPEALAAFVRAVHGSGFSAEAFLPCYGMAEVGLAISFSKLGTGAAVDLVDRNDCVVRRHARAISTSEGHAAREFVDCGRPLPGIQVEIRSPDGMPLAEREIGTIWVRTESVMEGYLGQPEATAEVLTSDGWLNTGDLGYLLEGRIVVTGREKDLIIVGGRNFWPQDLEYVAERQPGVRTGDAMAFSLDDGRAEQVVMLIQCRERDEDARARLRQTVRARIKTEFGIECDIELVDPHALPRTSSGKPSRSQAKRNYAATLTEDRIDAKGILGALA